MRLANSPFSWITQFVLVILIAGAFVLGLLQVSGVILDSLSLREVRQSEVLLAIMYINLLLVLTYITRGIET